MKKQNKNIKKSIKFIIITILVLVIMFIGFIFMLVIDDLKQEEKLKTEILDYYNKDLRNDDFSIKIKTKGDYAYVEQAIKQYYKGLSDNLKLIYTALNNEKIVTIFSTVNLESDRPDFIFNHTTIKNTRNDVSKAIKNINKLCEEKTIKGLLDKERFDDGDDAEYYYDFYLKLIYTKDDKKDIKKLKEQANSLETQINTYLDKLDQMLLFLQENDKSITYDQNNQVIIFKNTSLATEWKKLTVELSEIANNVGKETTTT